MRQHKKESPPLLSVLSAIYDAEKDIFYLFSGVRLFTSHKIDSLTSGANSMHSASGHIVAK